MMGRAHNHIRGTVSIYITRWRDRPAELAAEKLALHHLKFRVVELSYHCPGGPVENPTLAHILRRAEAVVSVIEIPILKGSADD